MYELNCDGIISGCVRVIHADSESDVVSRAVMEARHMGHHRISTAMLEQFRTRTVEVRDEPLRMAR